MSAADEYANEVVILFAENLCKISSAIQNALLAEVLEKHASPSGEIEDPYWRGYYEASMIFASEIEASAQSALGDMGLS